MTTNVSIAEPISSDVLRFGVEPLSAGEELLEAELRVHVKEAAAPARRVRVWHLLANGTELLLDTARYSADDGLAVLNVTAAARRRDGLPHLTLQLTEETSGGPLDVTRRGQHNDTQPLLVLYISGDNPTVNGEA